MDCSCPAYRFIYFIFFSSSFFVRCDIGHFWHITDLHLDLEYDPPEGHCLNTLKNSQTALGEYGCDAPWKLADSALCAMKKIKNSGDLHFILWTGDALTDVAGSYSQGKSLEIMHNATLLFKKYFQFSFVFPVLGHADLPLQDSSLFNHLANMWYHWLPMDAVQSFRLGGYYSIEFKYRRLKTVVLNSNLMMNDDNDDKYGQWMWLEKMLKTAVTNGDLIYLVAHVPPGFSELSSNSAPKCALPDKQNARFVDLIKTYSDVIVGQFYGHLHADTFRLFYDNAGEPVNYAFVAPSLTPRDGNNPAVRLYTFDPDTGQVYNYKQYYMDYKNINLFGETEWKLEYEFTSYYNVSKISALQLHKLKERFVTSNDSDLLDKYLDAYNVRGAEQTCHLRSVWRHYCAITHVERAYYNICMSENMEFKCPVFAKTQSVITTSGTTYTVSSYPVFIARLYMVIVYFTVFKCSDSLNALTIVLEFFGITLFGANPERSVFSCCGF